MVWVKELTPPNALLLCCPAVHFWTNLFASESRVSLDHESAYVHPDAPERDFINRLQGLALIERTAAQ
jgi:hypothetical protein